MSDLPFLPITALSRRIESGGLDPVTLADAFLARIDGVGRALNCYVSLDRVGTLAAAAAARHRAARHERIGPLDGIPIAVKDNIDVAGLPTTNGFGGSHSPAPADATVIARLRTAGAVILGKLNMQEGALGGVTDNAHHGRTTNPYRDGHTPGGSSGGSGAAVAAGLCAAALGTDTAGSVRIPAAYCAVVGLKPSYGFVSTHGVVPLSRGLDHVGPLTRTVADAALLLDAVAGADLDDPYSRVYPATTYAVPDHTSMSGLRLGVIEAPYQDDAEASVRSAFATALELMRSLGAQIQSVVLPHYNPAQLRRAIFMRVEIEAAAEHGALYGKEPQRFSPAMRRYLDWGLAAPALRLVEGDRMVADANHALARCFADVDAVVAPTTPQAAFSFDRKPPANQNTYCVLANIAGSPAISVPMGLDERGLPLGLQIMVPRGKDRCTLAIAAAYEAAAMWHLTPPPPFGPSDSSRAA